VGQANRTLNAGRLRDAGGQIDLVAGQTLTAPSEVAGLLLTTRDGRPVYVAVLGSDFGLLRLPGMRQLLRRAIRHCGTLSKALRGRSIDHDGDNIGHRLALLLYEGGVG
jgi:hypothetical protein